MKTFNNFYYAVQEYENGRYCTHVQRINNSNNLLHAFSKKAVVVMACKTKKEAEDIANFWNECSLKNGKYLFQESGKTFPAVCI